MELDFEVSDSQLISEFGNELKNCILTREDDLKNILKKRGKWDNLDQETKHDLYISTPIWGCLDVLFKENNTSKVAIIGTMCSGKSTFWSEYNPLTDKGTSRKIAKIGLDEEGQIHQMTPLTSRYYTTHRLLDLDELCEDDCIIVIERDLDDKIECGLKERRQWDDKTKESIKEELLKQEKRIQNVLDKLKKTNIINIKWKQKDNY